MKILLDENLPRKLKIDFGDEHEVKTVRDMGWSGKKNGELLKPLDTHEFDFFVTIDQNLKLQQNLDKFNIKIFLLAAVSNRRENLQGLTEKIKYRMANGEYQKITVIS